MNQPKKKLKAESESENSPAWQQKVESVMKLQVKGHTVNEIIALTEIDERTVRRITKQEVFADGVQEIKQKITKEAFKGKVPVIKDIISRSLTAIQETLMTFENEDVRKEMLSRPADIQALTKVVSDLNNLLRLELGESTQNIAIKSNSYQETRVVLQELRKIDPVFDYPELPAPPKELPPPET
jgi:hypothetical protein